MAYFDIGAFNPWGEIAVVPNFSALGRYVVIKLLRSYRIDALREVVNFLSRDQSSLPQKKNDPTFPVWCCRIDGEVLLLTRIL